LGRDSLEWPNCIKTATSNTVKIKKLTEKYKVPISHIALGYLLSQRVAVIPVFSSSSIEQLNDTILDVEIKLSEDEIKLLDSLDGSGRV